MAVSEKEKTVDEKELKTAKEGDIAPVPDPVLEHLQPTLNPAYYLNRELSLLDFHIRVLDEAMDERNPPLERARFLSIFGSNLDEFFMIRLAGIHEQVKTGVTDLSLDGMTPSQEMEVIYERIQAVLRKQSSFFRDTLLQ